MGSSSNKTHEDYRSESFSDRARELPPATLNRRTERGAALPTRPQDSSIHAGTEKASADNITTVAERDTGVCDDPATVNEGC